MMKNWNILYTEELDTSLNPQKLQNILFENRDIKDKKEQASFMHPDLSSVTLKSVDIDAAATKIAKKRIEKAIKDKEQIIVYGDYDVDGITASAILWETLTHMSAVVMPYIPHRVDEGYGLSLKGIDTLLLQYPQTTLIITVDNGIVAGKAVEYAKTKGIDVIITDHHLQDAGQELPPAYAIVHTTKLCGAGIAWLFAKELLGVDERLQDDHLELAALGTIADLVPLKGANRTLVYHGLPKLTKTARKGLRALFDIAGITGKDIGVYEVGHMIAPRLNAAGRLETAMDSLRLICTKDTKRAQLLAEQLDGINSERQTIMKDSTLHASTTVRPRAIDKRIIIIADESYAEGVIGLIAGKLVEEYYRPAIVIAKGEKVSKGSVRSIHGFNIISFLREHKEFFVNVGGHPMAAGFTISTDKIELFQKTLEDNALLAIGDELLVRTLMIDCEIDLHAVSTDLHLAIQSLSPFGMGNPEPLFLSKKVYVREVRTLGKEGKHLRLILGQDETSKPIEAVAFGMGERITEIPEDGYLDIVYTIDENTWKGTTKLQLKVRDFRSM